tara:strand:- start:85 stop:273 length:189 start_codon:yes stop_codon:yes gene_type:complete
MNKVNRNMNLWILGVSILVTGFVFAGNANGAIRRVCLESITDNGTKVMTHSACKVDAPTPKI